LDLDRLPGNVRASDEPCKADLRLGGDQRLRREQIVNKPVEQSAELSACDISEDDLA
jgi:hypothetical protein